MFKKLFNWEYWPSYMFYIPNLPYAFYLVFKARNLVFFSAANPGIKHSGNGTESKFKTLELIPKEFIPTSILIKKDSQYKAIEAQISAHKLSYPLIIKPDVGYRGMLVKKINATTELKAYLKKYNSFDLILQEFIDYPQECGIFYYRIPNEATGHISSITLKDYLAVTGDGHSTLESLVKANPRVFKHYDLIKSLHIDQLQTVIPKDEKYVLNVIGNHSKGTTFLDGNHLIDASLEKAIDGLLKRIPHVFYGRIDLKYESLEALKRQENFKIIEINGIISEPTHIYDPYKSTYFKALKEIRKHWKILYKVATVNNKVYKVKYDSTSNFVKSLRELKAYTNEIAHKSVG